MSNHYKQPTHRGPHALLPPQKATRYHTLLCFINVLVICSNGTVGFVGFLQGNDQQSILLNRVAASQSRAFALLPIMAAGGLG